MKVLVAPSAGFCWGVRRAVDTASRIAEDTRGPVYTDGPLIHNEQLMAQLQDHGIHESGDPAGITDGPLVIRAHGIPPARREALTALPLQLIDATCPDVARIQGIIRKHARQGYATLIFGDTGHPEVIGLLGFAEDRGHVITGPEDIDTLPDLDRVCLVSQSTQLPDTYANIARAVTRRFPDAVVLDTICEATRQRQEDVKTLARDVDRIVVVGGARSANTRRLSELAATLRPTVLVQTANQLDPKDFKDARVVGLTAGASTPGFVIDAVRQALEAL